MSIASRVNILGEALDGLGRWYVAVPPFLIIGFLAALFFLTGAGQERLQEASERLQRSALREHVIDDLQIGVSRSVSAQRGYLLTGEDRFLQSYQRNTTDVEPRLERLQSAYMGADSALADVRTLHILIGKRLADLSMIIAIQKTQGTSAAIALIRTRVGSDTGEAVNDLLEQLRGRESAEHGAAEQDWSRSLTLSRWITIAGTLFNMLLVGVVLMVFGGANLLLELATFLTWNGVKYATHLSGHTKFGKLEKPNQLYAGEFVNDSSYEKLGDSEILFSVMHVIRQVEDRRLRKLFLNAAHGSKDAEEISQMRKDVLSLDRRVSDRVTSGS